MKSSRRQALGAMSVLYSAALTPPAKAAGGHPPIRLVVLDIGGTIVEERIYHDAGATTVQGLRRAELLQLIRKAGREPIERYTLYRPVERTEATFTVLV